MNLKNKTRAAGIAFGIAFFIFTIFAGLWISFSDLGFYAAFREEKMDYAYIGKSPEEVERITEDLIRYVQFGGEENLAPHFNEREILHMIDVRRLFVLSLILMGAGAVTALATWIWGRKKEQFYKTAFRTLLLTIALAAAGGIAMVLSFDTAFVRFHELFFNNDLWLLDPRTDMMIRMLPQELFTRLFIRTLIIAALLNAGVLIRLNRLRRKTWNITE